MPTTSPFNRLILRAVLRDVYPMVIQLVAVPDCLELADFDDIFHAVLGWEGGSGYAFYVHSHAFTSFRRQTRSTTLRDFRLHRHETFLYTLGALDQWEWELRVVDRQDGTAGRRDADVRGWAGRDASSVRWRPHRLSADVEATGGGTTCTCPLRSTP